jgi:predicted nucleotidyltransferase
MKTLDDLRLEERERRALAEATRRLRARFPVERVILFGSRARGDADAESDFDLLVLTARELNWQERGQLVDCLFDIQLEHEVLLSPLSLARRDWDEGLYRVLPIHLEVERDGIVL